MSVFIVTQDDTVFVVTSTLSRACRWVLVAIESDGDTFDWSFTVTGGVTPRITATGRTDGGRFSIEEWDVDTQPGYDEDDPVVMKHD